MFVPAYSKIPRGYGVAYTCWDRDGGICYPIPFNIIVALLYKLRLWAIMPFGRVLDRAKMDAYRRGKADGAMEGRKEMRSYFRGADKIITNLEKIMSREFQEMLDKEKTK
jgi:hypothetical protein